MLSGTSPFKAPTDYLIFQKIKHLEYTIPNHFSPEAKDIIQKLLTLDPTKRLGKEGTEAIKQHPFFDGLDWEHLFECKAPSLKEALAEEIKRNPLFDESIAVDSLFRQAFEGPLCDQLAKLQIEPTSPKSHSSNQ